MHLRDWTSLNRSLPLQEK
ncbi:hypothetical protein MAR_017839 [Mya arenaria]|uniref:Uncharacterized protein n=1 Tax=Mya arenaria TaxID=6604 RepID=A0ABY7EGF7_MYAAR|nr:hypothetical protein MAR_017839 [Mya arenaria]